MKNLILILLLITVARSFAQSNLSLRINAGGPEVTYNGDIFLADQYFTGGKVYVNNNAQVSTLFKTERSADPPTFNYNISVDNGEYQVTLYFADIYFGATGGGIGGNGKRIFDVSIENQIVLDDYDIYAEVGGQTETTKTFNVTVSDGVLDIYFSALSSDGGVDQPKLSALEVTGLPSSDSQSPTAPTLSSTAKTENTVNLSWSGATDNVGVTGYKIYQNGSLVATEGNVSNYQVTALSASTLYNFTVKALDAAGNESSDSNQLSITTNSSPDTQDPEAPTLSIASETDTTVDLSWSGSSDNIGVTSYKIYQDGSLIATLGIVSTYQVTGLAPSTSYSFTVMALDSAGNESVASNIVLATTDTSSGNGGGSGTNQNIAQGKMTIQSSTYGGFDSGLAVDGDITNFNHTNTTTNNWWRLDLGEEYDINRIVVFNRASSCCSGRLNGFEIKVASIDSQDPNQFTSTNITLNTNLEQEFSNLTLTARYIMVHKAESGILNIGDFEVYGSPVNTTQPPIGGDSPWTNNIGDIYYNSGGVAIGRSTVPSGYKLAVDGNIRTREIRVDQESWPDYVFSKDYELLSLEEIQKHIQEKGHLPNIPSAKEVKANGIEVGEMNKLLLEKIEELTLHLIQLKAEIQILKNNRH